MRYFATLDWVELYCAMPPDAPLRSIVCASDIVSDAHVYRCELRQYGTRVYRYIVDVVMDDTPLLTITHTPLSARSHGGIMPDDMCHVKLANYYLYRDDWYTILTHALRLYRINPIRLSRIDIACDWQYGVCGLYAGDLLSGLIKRRYLKIHQPNWRANGVDGRRMSWQSLAFGSKSSPVFTRFYNKTRELEVTGKDYIRECWKSAGLNLQRDVYRVEFQLTDTGKHVVDTETGAVLDISIEDVIDRVDVAKMFIHYAQHYFDIRKANTACKRTECARVLLFPDAPNMFVAYQRPRSATTARTDKVVVRQMVRALFAMCSVDQKRAMYHSIRNYVTAKNSNVLCEGALRLLLDCIYSRTLSPDSLVDEMFEMTKEHFQKYDRKGLWIYKIVKDCDVDYEGEDRANMGALMED